LNVPVAFELHFMKVCPADFGASFLALLNFHDVSFGEVLPSNTPELMHLS
jgi:hypothetical protein